MKILFIHHAFPGQFIHLAPLLAVEGHTVYAITEDEPVYRTPNVTIHQYKQGRKRTKDIHPWLNATEEKYIRAESVLVKCRELEKSGFTPDVIYAHSDWGEALFLRDVFPDSKIILFAEHFYTKENSDAVFDNEFAETSLFMHCGMKTNNAIRIMALDDCDLAICPTLFQKNNHPNAYHHKIKQVHDGIPTHRLKKNDKATLSISGKNITLTKKDTVITFANRGLEPRRGFHQFMRAIPVIQKNNSNAHIIIMGKDIAVYGVYKKLPDDMTFKQYMMAELGDKINYDKVYFVDWVDYNTYKSIIELSTVHVYLTAPFVLSWSMLEVMSVEGCVIGSNTTPVTEVIEDGANGVLVDFFSPDDIAGKVSELLNDKGKRERIGKNARQIIIEKYDLNTICLPKQIELIENLVK
ncbi:MAG: glycosyltransferase [gamma proteobacterium symbiont of Taylorina sp.]|nr:glycosyltransferase [gamma proteobacterium symbiont of Taylorina sp.]